MAATDHYKKENAPGQERIFKSNGNGYVGCFGNIADVDFKLSNADICARCRPKRLQSSEFDAESHEEVVFLYGT